MQIRDTSNAFDAKQERLLLKVTSQRLANTQADLQAEDSAISETPFRMHSPNFDFMVGDRARVKGGSLAYLKKSCTSLCTNGVRMSFSAVILGGSSLPTITG